MSTLTSRVLYAALLGQLVAQLGWIDPLFIPLVLAGPLVTGAVLAYRARQLPLGGSSLGKYRARHVVDGLGHQPLRRAVPPHAGRPHAPPGRHRLRSRPADAAPPLARDLTRNNAIATRAPDTARQSTCGY